MKKWIEPKLNFDFFLEHTNWEKNHTQTNGTDDDPKTGKVSVKMRVWLMDGQFVGRPEHT